jgi:hypothetical protein
MRMRPQARYYSVQTPDLSAFGLDTCLTPPFSHMQRGDGNGGGCLQVREKGSKSLKKVENFTFFSVLLNALFKRERKNLRNTTQSG